MTDGNSKDESTGNTAREKTPLPSTGRTAGRMHDDVPDWSDPVCSCEAEPYWVAVAEELNQEQEQKQETTKKTPEHPK